MASCDTVATVTRVRVRVCDLRMIERIACFEFFVVCQEALPRTNLYPTQSKSHFRLITAKRLHWHSLKKRKGKGEGGRGRCYFFLTLMPYRAPRKGLRSNLSFIPGRAVKVALRPSSPRVQTSAITTENLLFVSFSSKS